MQTVDPAPDTERTAQEPPTLVWLPIATLQLMPDETQLLFWIEKNYRRAIEGRVFAYHDGEIAYVLNGFHGSFDVTHWMVVAQP